MGTMEPSDTFTLTLRGYQKQALLSEHWNFCDVFILTKKLQVDAFARIWQDGCSRIHFDAPPMESVRSMIGLPSRPLPIDMVVDTSSRRNQL
jgi:hypothetical protein